MLVVDGIGGLLLRGVHDLVQVQTPLLAQVGAVGHKQHRQGDQRNVENTQVPGFSGEGLILWSRNS